MEIPLKVESLSKTFGQRKIVSDLSFQVKLGSIHGFLGPNGAGKSTTIKMLTGLMLPTSGSVEIFGKKLDPTQSNYKSLIGLLPEHLPLYLDMTPRESLQFMMKLHHQKLDSSREEQMIELYGLKEVYERPIGHLSRGFRQRIGLAQAMVFDPKLIILDEPTNGLDPQSVVEFREILRHLSKTKTILFSSHILSEVELLCDEVTIIHQGQIKGSGPIEILGKQFKRGQKIHFLTKNSEVQIPNAKKNQTNTQGEVLWTIDFTDENDHRREVFEYCAEKKIQILELWTEKSDLEDLFLQLTESKK